jgi:hypothetical protein
MNIPEDLRPGDILLYGPFAAESTLDKIIDGSIEWKTASDVDHIEIASDVQGRSWASRNGIGVNSYPFRADGLKYVRRPLGFEVKEAIRYFMSVDGTPYGFGDIEENIGIENKQPGMDCSHFAAALLEAAFIGQFDKNFDKRKISPRDFLLSNQSNQIWPTVQTS